VPANPPPRTKTYQAVINLTQESEPGEPNSGERRILKKNKS